MKADNESRKAEQIDEPNSEQKRLAEIEARPKQPPIEPIGPVDPMDLDKSLKMFLRDQTDVKESTVEEYDDDLDWFREFCEKNDIEITTEVTSQIIKKYRHWRKYESSNRVDQLATKTMRDEMFLIRNYIRFLEQINAVKYKFSDGIKIPKLDGDEGVRDYDFEPDQAEAMLSYLKKYEYASIEHVVCLLLIKTSRRLGGLYSLDVDDVVTDVEKPYILFEHDEETQLKNNTASYTEVNIYPETVKILQDYISNNRHDVAKNGRRPLLTSTDGRLSESTMRKYMYKFSRPCVFNNSCPHDRDPNDCTAATDLDQASKCPSSVPPHAARHGHITELRRQGVDIDEISDRCDVSPAIIKKHYDERDESQKRQDRRSLLDDAHDNSEGGFL